MPISNLYKDIPINATVYRHKHTDKLSITISQSTDMESYNSDLIHNVRGRHLNRVHLINMEISALPDDLLETLKNCLHVTGGSISSVYANLD